MDKIIYIGIDEDIINLEKNDDFQYKIVSFDNLKLGYDFLIENNDDVIISLIDVSHNEEDLYEFIPKFKRINNKEINFIVLSNESDYNNVTFGITQGGSDYISKPYDYDRLNTLIEKFRRR